MEAVTPIDQMRARLARMTPSQVREIAQRGKQHAKLRARLDAGTISTTGMKVLAKIEGQFAKSGLVKG